MKKVKIYHRENTGIIFSPNHENVKYDWFALAGIHLDEFNDVVTTEIHLWSSEEDALNFIRGRFGRTFKFTKGSIENVPEAWAKVFDFENQESNNGETVTLKGATFVAEIEI